MITPEQGLRILQDTIKHKRRHKDYERVVFLSDLYHKIISGERLEELLKPFTRRETEEEFKQRVSLTQQIAPSIAESIMTPFYRPGRLDNITRGLNYNTDNGTQSETLQEKLLNFYGGESVERYLSTRFVDLSFSDPNAFISVDIAPFEARKLEEPQAYPYEISSTEAINYEYQSGVLNWLISHVVTKERYEKTGKDRTQEKYYFYAAGFVLVATQLVNERDELPLYDTEGAFIPLKNYDTFGDNTAGWFETASKKYTYDLYQTKLSDIQVVRVGYKPDKQTNGRTCVSPLHPAMPYFLKMVKAVSELDLSVSLHVFPQKAVYEQPCPGSRTEHGMSPCISGVDQFGATCKTCSGTGVLSHRGASDVLVYPKPKHKDDLVPLADLQHYYELPIHIVQWLDTYVDKLKTEAIRAVFNSDVIERPNSAETATKVVSDKEEMYNTLYPFTENYSAVYRSLVYLIAGFNDLANGLEVLFEFPSDFKLKSESEMLQDLKAAKDSGASAFMIQEIERDIARKRFADNEEAYKKYLTKTLFTPFLGKSEAYITQLFMSGDVRPEDKVLYNYVDTIFDELQMDMPAFFDMAYSKQKAIVDKKVKEILDTLPTNSLTLDLGIDAASGLDTPVDVEAEAKANLKGSVGGVQGIIGIQESVAKGVTQYEAAVTLLFEIYGFDDATARKLLGNSTALKQAEVETKPTSNKGGAI